MVRSASTSGSAGDAGRPKPGAVERAARIVLADIDTDHAASDLLAAVAERLAQDIDQVSEVRDRVAASRELREVLRELDTAVVPPRAPAAPPPGAAAPAAGGGADDDDVFEIGDRAPELGDAEAG